MSAAGVELPARAASADQVQEYANAVPQWPSSECPVNNRKHFALTIIVKNHKAEI